jgi:hypothetical protein
MFSCFALQDMFSCFARPDLFSAVARASDPVFMFCPPRHVYGGSDGVGSRFHVLRSLTRYQRYGGRRVQFSCFVRPDSSSAETKVPGPTFMFPHPETFPAVPRVSGPVFKFCAPELFFCGTAGIGSHFLVLRARTRFRRNRGCRLPYSCFMLPDSFSALPRASAPVFMFYVPRLIFEGTKGVRSRFHVLRSQTCFRRCRLRRVLFSYFARPDSFSA